jgi:hypothetical protein
MNRSLASIAACTETSSGSLKPIDCSIDALPGTRTSPGQSVRGPPANPYRDDGGQALIRINAAPMFGQRLTFRHGLLRTPAVTATSECHNESNFTKLAVVNFTKLAVVEKANPNYRPNRHG